eukprot:TRINITY_DN3366_c0_g1_i2.p1 TRINITY_DN3366_c0_g1~~TRINITY_DN3366_c0_g1_i2.p1  ORF type:complete len:458 (+),score=117.55 TRINITY_DN3366_c0_g1_i2:42-1415(+)
MIKFFLCLSILFLIANGLKWKKIGDENWQEIDTYVFKGNTNYLPYPFIEKLVPINNIRGIGDDSIYSCKEVMNSMKIEGKIALIGYGNGCPIERHIEIAQNAGAIAAVIITEWEMCNYLDQQTHKYSNKIPAICIEHQKEKTEKFLNSFISLNKNEEEEEEIYVEFTAENNPIKKLNYFWMTFCRVFFLCFFATNTVLLMIRMVHFCRVGEKNLFSFPYVIFLSLLLLNLISSSKFYDPYGYFSVINNWQYNLKLVVLSFIPFTVLYVSLNIYFFQAMKSVENICSNWRKFVLLLSISLSLSSIFVYLSYYLKLAVDESQAPFVQAISSILTIIDNIVFLTRFILIVKTIVLTRKKHFSENPSIKNEMKWIHFWISISSFVYFLVLTASLLTNFEEPLNKPFKRLIIYCCFYFGYAVSSFGLFFLFDPVDKKVVRTDDLVIVNFDEKNSVDHVILQL